MQALSSWMVRWGSRERKGGSRSDRRVGKGRSGVSMGRTVTPEKARFRRSERNGSRRLPRLGLPGRGGNLDLAPTRRLLFHRLSQSPLMLADTAHINQMADPPERLTVAGPHVRVTLRIRQLASQRRLTLACVADRAGVSRSHLSAVLALRKSPTLHWMGQIASALEVDVVDLLSCVD